jgi:hypothetical protein
MHPTGPRITASPRTPRGLPPLRTLLWLRLQLLGVRLRIRFWIFVRTLGRGPRGQ